MTVIPITEVCRRTGLTSRTLRFYETRGLLGAQRTPAGLRCYGTAELARLHNITALKRAGFSLARIGELLDGPARANGAIDLPRVIETQLGVLAAQSAAVNRASASLMAAQRALAAGRALDLDTFCTLIKEGETIMSNEAQWQQVYDRYYTPGEQAEWLAAKTRVFGEIDFSAYQRDWKALTDRIEAALPLDPASPAAQAFVAEWRVLQEPWTRIAGPLMHQGTINLYDRIDEWSDMVEPPFSKAVWDFIGEAANAGPS